MKKLALGALSLVLVCLLPSVCRAQAQDLPMVFSIPAGTNPSQVWVQFVTTGSLTGYYNDTSGVQHALAANTPYSLAQITSPVSVGNGAPANVPAMLVGAFNGRVYVNFGSAGLQNLGPSYTPDASSSGDPNFNTRYQYFEPTFAAVSSGGANGTSVNVDLSYIDFMAISLTLTAVNPAHVTNSPQTSSYGQTMVSAAAGASLTTNAAVLPSASDLLPNAAFARVLGPHLSPTGYYHDFSNYLAFLNGQTATIKGVFAGVGVQPTGNVNTQAQTYDYVATFNSTTQQVTLVAQSDSGLGTDVTIPVNQQGPGVGNNATITIAYSDLNAPTGIYGANTPYTVNNPANPYNGGNKTAGIVNDVYGRVVGDLCGGLDFGFIGSTQTFDATSIGGTSSQAIGTLASTQWWGGGNGSGATFVMPGSTTTYPNSGTPAIQGVYFSKVQSNSLYYDPYANALASLTTGYSFPFGDRLGNDLLYMDNASTPTLSGYLQVTINPDASPTPAPQPTPAPTVRINGKATVHTQKASYVVKGKAGGDITRVNWQIGNRHGKAAGKASWHFTAKLKIGRNVIKVTAVGPGGDSKPAKVTIIREE
jgi:hypothetical protein